MPPKEPLRMPEAPDPKEQSDAAAPRRLVVLVGIVLALLAGAVFYFSLTNTSDTSHVPVVTKVNNHTLSVEIVDTPRKRAEGLSGRASIGDHEGMLFVWDESDTHGIWMKDMNFAIDILWINEAFEVVDIKKNTTPDSYPTVFTPETPARYVLETAAGWAESHGIAIGDAVAIPLPERE